MKYSNPFSACLPVPASRPACWPAPARAQAERLKDLASIQGVRGNQLIGYGLVVGLDGSGDQVRQTPFTQQSLTNMLSQLGITVPAGSNMQLKSVAAVMVTATLPAFARPGQTMDVVVSSMGNAKSARRHADDPGADSQVYAIAQGQHPGRRRGRLGRWFQRADQPAQRRPHQRRRASSSAACQPRVRARRLSTWK